MKSCVLSRRNLGTKVLDDPADLYLFAVWRTVLLMNRSSCLWMRNHQPAYEGPQGVLSLAKKNFLPNFFVQSSG